MPACTNATLCMFKGLHVANSFVHLMLCSSETNVCQCSELVTMVGVGIASAAVNIYLLNAEKNLSYWCSFSYERSDQ
jgi:hypothetical protein